MDLWDQEAVEIVGPGIVELRPDGTATIRFIAVEAWLDLRPTERDGRPAIEFSWEGDDEGTAVSGRGWIALAGADEIVGHIFFHMGDDSGFSGARLSPSR